VTTQPDTDAPPTLKDMTEDEWYALGNPPGSFDDVLEMGRQNAEAMKRASRTPHPWDSFVSDPERRDWRPE
jgi:hypothetical protein